ncbi:facilitated trehalose transporter Tret1-like isoform X1 [Sitodiplosis mosellana]|uniref:facilitated trehalose transporter Tret1-like isoform X1 n=2 Tax=Sitodiplosis mosellana TaxID=263140 RepID=UPI0024442037|nr:facilitated trehalose transporter Tret1-like isoform X1 [Sitodiplosis mosellana]
MLENSESHPKLSNVKNQIYATIIANIIVVSFGSCVGWFSPALRVLLSDETPLKTGPLTNEKLSWIGAMNSFGALCGTFISGFLSIRLGSKRAMTVLALPAVTVWILIYFGDSFYHIFFARFATGCIGGGFQSGVILFVAEISNDNIRGRLGSVFPLARNTGILLANIAAAVVDYEHRPFIFVVFPVIFFIWINFLPSTPEYYLQCGKVEEAKRALMFYKSVDGESSHETSLLQSEFEQIQRIEMERRRSAKIQPKDYYNRAALKGIGIAIAMVWLFQSTGFFIIVNYASLIYKISGTALKIEISTIVLSVAQILGGLVATQLGDTFGRKTTLIISLFGSAIGLFTFAIHSYLRQNQCDVSHFTWVPEVCLSFVIFISSAGIVALANTFVVESFPPKISCLLISTSFEDRTWIVARILNDSIKCSYQID